MASGARIGTESRASSRHTAPSEGRVARCASAASSRHRPPACTSRRPSAQSTRRPSLAPVPHSSLRTPHLIRILADADAIVVATPEGSGSVSLGLPLGEGPRLRGRMSLAPRPKGGRGKLTHYLPLALARGLPLPARSFPSTPRMTHHRGSWTGGGHQRPSAAIGGGGGNAGESHTRGA